MYKPNRTNPIIWWGLLALLLVVGIGPAGADIFVLNHGGRIEGQWVNRDKQAAEPYEIKLDSGGQLRLEPSQVERLIAQTVLENEYRRLVAGQPDTVDGNWKIAQWCQQQQLKQLREKHLERILELDTDHVGARYGLGYSQVRGQWILRDEYMRDQGYELYQGRWRSPQEIQLAEERKQLQQAEKDWYTQLRRWREMVGGENAREAYRGLSKLKDPLAIPALQALLKEEKYRPIKLLYIEALGRINNRASAAVLIQTSLSDPDEEVFYASVTELARDPTPEIEDAYLKILKDNNNVRVNRAAYALGYVGDASCVSPLIDALITQHKIVIPGNPNAHTATFSQPSGNSPFGGSGLTAGDQTKVFYKMARNEAVLDALIRLTKGANFSFDQRAWEFWLANENAKASHYPDGRTQIQP